ncbi:MAG TPA: hypothetical protein VH414_11250 [Lichenihabitans sp.]|nr:hypothetical protein [Lichenihabitans sp.]
MSSLDSNKSDQQEAARVKTPVSPAKATNQTSFGPEGWNKSEPRALRAGSLTQARQGDAEYTSAFRLVHKASEAIDVLQERCRRLESDIRDTNERSRSEAESSERVIKDWERLATALKAQLSKTEANLADAQQSLKALEERAAAAETRIQETEQRLQASDLRAQEAETRAMAAEQLASQESELALSFQHTIIEAFGTDSRLSSALAGESGH